MSILVSLPPTPTPAHSSSLPPPPFFLISRPSDPRPFLHTHTHNYHNNGNTGIVVTRSCQTFQDNIEAVKCLLTNLKQLSLLIQEKFVVTARMILYWEIISNFGGNIAWSSVGQHIIIRYFNTSYDVLVICIRVTSQARRFSVSQAIQLIFQMHIQANNKETTEA